MSIIFPDAKHSIHVHGHQAEVVRSKSAKIKLLVDRKATDGALSTVQVTLEKDADGARPHRHDHSAEMFYVLDGSVQCFPALKSLKPSVGTSSWFRRGCLMPLPRSWPWRGAPDRRRSRHRAL